MKKEKEFVLKCAKCGKSLFVGSRVYFYEQWPETYCSRDCGEENPEEIRLECDRITADTANEYRELYLESMENAGIPDTEEYNRVKLKLDEGRDG